MAEGLVFMTTLNAHIIALDAETGKKVWDQTYGDVRAGESATVAPLIVKDMVIVGSSGGEFGSRGHTDAFKLETGERVWRCYMVPKPGEPGSETWPADGEAWQRGGANCWVTPTYDPDLNLLYYGTGNPCPDFDGDVREGDNLYTDSGVAVDADTGEIKSHFQYTPHDLWDYDSTMEHILFDLDGQKLAAHFDKNGFLYILDRTNMEPVRVAPFVDRIDWGEVDEKGNVTPLRLPRQGGRPGALLARPGRRQGVDARRATARRPSSSTARCRTSARRPRGGAGSSRRASRTGARASRWTSTTWRAPSAPSTRAPARRGGAGANDLPMCSSVLATGGGLVFAGEPTRRVQRARRGDRRPPVGVPVRQRPPLQPVARYSVDGRQYIAAPTRLGRLDRGVPARDARRLATGARCSPSRCRRTSRNPNVCTETRTRRRL